MSVVLMPSVVSQPAQLSVVTCAADDPGYYWVFDFEDTEQSDLAALCAEYVALPQDAKEAITPADHCDNEVLRDVGRLITFLRDHECPLTGSDSFQVGSPRHRVLHKHRIGLAARPGELATVKV